MSSSASFLGTGWSFPPSFDKISSSAVMVSDVEDIRQSLFILLSTSLGERVMLPEYGCNLTDYQFEPINNTFLGFLHDLVRRAILFYEPRIEVNKISITEADDFGIYDGKLIIEVEYTIAGTNSRYNYVYDFYLKEADRQI